MTSYVRATYSPKWLRHCFFGPPPLRLATTACHRHLCSSQPLFTHRTLFTLMSLTRLPIPLPCISTQLLFHRPTSSTSTAISILCFPIHKNQTIDLEQVDEGKMLVKLTLNANDSIETLRQKLALETGFAKNSIKLYYVRAPASDAESLERGRQAVFAGQTKMLSLGAKVRRIFKRGEGSECTGTVLFKGAQVNRPGTLSRIKKTVQDVLHDISYRPPMPLLDDTGLIWDFQYSQQLLELLGPPLSRQFEHYLKGNKPDKSVIPLYSFVSGPGTGKSRNGTEFLKLCMHSVNNPLLEQRLENARVFNISLENNTPYEPRIEGDDPDRIIAVRILHQLFGEQKSIPEILEEVEVPLTITLLRALATKDKKDFFREWTAILVIDGIHNLMNPDGTGLVSDLLYRLSTITLSRAFIPVCITATLSSPLQQYHRIARQVILELPVIPLSRPTIGNAPVFDTSSELVELLVDDCGGHGRALEALSQMLHPLQNTSADPKNQQIQSSLPLTIGPGVLNVDAFMAHVRRSIRLKYQSTILHPKDLVGILAAVIGRRRFRKEDSIPRTIFTVEQLVSRGLFRFVPTPNLDSEFGIIEAPYIWIHIILGAIQIDKREGPKLHDALKYLTMSDYNKLFKSVGGKFVLEPPTPEGFERMVVNYRCLKSTLFDEDEQISMHDVHAGARIVGDVVFRNRHLTPAQLQRRMSTKSSDNRFDPKKVHLNARGAPAGDFVTTLESTDALINEVGQCKLYRKSTILNQDLYNEEARKSAVPGVDFFILFTPKSIQSGSITLGSREALVDGDCWQDYFGFMYARAYKLYPSLGSSSRS